MDYTILDRDFIERTLSLIDQYRELIKSLKPEEIYDHTLLLNCFLGLIILPHEIHFSYLPKDKDFAKWGLTTSKICDSSASDIRELVRKLRNSAAHFSFEVHGDGNNKIKQIIFKNTDNTELIKFDEKEIYPFPKNLSVVLLKNIDKYKYDINASRTIASR